MACMSCEVIELPDLYPTQFLYNNHKNKGKENWEIFAWAARDIMQIAGNFKLCDLSMKEKQAYEKYMQMNPK